MFGGATKLIPLQILVVSRWVILVPPAAFAVGLTEVTIGWLCIAFSQLKLLKSSVLGAFSVYICVLAVKWWLGEEGCQCSGGTGLSVHSMMILDGMVFASIVWSLRHWSEPCHVSPAIAIRIRNLQILLPAMLILLIVIFGSIGAAMTFFSGQRLVVDSPSKFAGSVKEGDFAEVSFRLSNFSAQGIRVIGAKSSCSCLAILDLPVSIESWESKQIRVLVFASRPRP